jgi:hypothetical protein
MIELETAGWQIDRQTNTWVYWDEGEIVGYVGQMVAGGPWFSSLQGGETPQTEDEAKATTEVLYRMGQRQVW